MTANVWCYYKLNQFLAVKLHVVADITSLRGGRKILPSGTWS